MFQCAVLAYNTMRWMALLSVVMKVTALGDPDRPNFPDTRRDNSCEAAINSR